MILICILAVLPLSEHPSAVHAQSTSTNQSADSVLASSSNPSKLVCNISQIPDQPDVFCVPQDQKIIEFKPGDSNTTIEAKRQAEEKAKKAALLAKAKLAAKATVTLASATSDSVIKLYQQAGQCIPFAREMSGIQVSGAARTVPVTTKTPQVGAIMISYDSPAGHASVVTAVLGDLIEVEDRNWIPGWVTKRLVPKNSGTIKGFVTKS